MRNALVSRVEIADCLSNALVSHFILFIRLENEADEIEREM